MKQGFFSLLVTCFVVFVATSNFAAAETVYVDAANSSGFEDGTIAYPFDTIQEGIDAAAIGTAWETADVVSVAPGIYMGAIIMKNYVKLVGQDPARTIIDGEGVRHQLIQGPDETWSPRLWLEGFTIRNSRGTAVWTLTRINYYGNSHWEIKNCRFINNGEAVYCALGSSANITQSLIVGGESSGGVRMILTFYPVTLTNTTLSGFSSQALWTVRSSAGITVTNSIIANSKSIFKASGTVVRTNHTLFHNYETVNSPWNETDFNWVQTASIMDDPQFADPDAGDYTLLGGSPAIDAGIDVGLPYVGVAPDLGAFESGELTFEESLEGLAVSYSDVAPEALKGPSEQRREAYLNKVEAIFNQLEASQREADDERRASLNGIRAKLEKDLLAKCDGGHGGNPSNDWITDPVERDSFYAEILALIELVDQEIAETVQ